MISPKVEEFLESHNMTYLFLMLADLEVERLSNLPEHIKKKFDLKITEQALLHVAKNEVPDYIADDASDPFEEEKKE
jgi:hypothetical protein